MFNEGLRDQEMAKKFGYTVNGIVAVRRRLKLNRYKAKTHKPREQSIEERKERRDELRN